MKKLFAAIISVLLMLTVVALPISAAQIEDNTVQPRWTNTSHLTCSISYTDINTGYAHSVVRGDNGASCVKTDVYVYEYVNNDWSYLTEKHETNYSWYGTMNCEFSAVANREYRADFTFTVTKGGVDEVITRTVYSTNTPQA